MYAPWLGIPPVSVKEHSFYASLGHAIQQQELLSGSDLVLRKLIVPDACLSGGVPFFADTDTSGDLNCV